MTVERTISKRLAGDEDFALGEGTETQSRNGQNVTITQVRRIQPVNSIEELNALDTTRYVKACLFNATTDTFHLYEFSSGTWNLLKSADVDPAGSLALETKELASGQVAVTFTNPTDAAAFHVSGPDVDNTRLFAGKDYSVNHTTKTVTLFNSYPAGTNITSMFYELIGGNLGTASTLDFGRGDDQVPRNSDLVANTVAELRNIEPQSTTDRIELLGHTIPGVGGGVFQASSTTDADDNGVAITTAGGAKWVRVLNGYVTPEMFGWYSTLSQVNSTIAIQACWDSDAAIVKAMFGSYKAGNLVFPNQDFVLTGKFNIYCAEAPADTHYLAASYKYLNNVAEAQTPMSIVPLSGDPRDAVFDGGGFVDHPLISQSWNSSCAIYTKGGLLAGCVDTSETRDGTTFPLSSKVNNRWLIISRANGGCGLYGRDSARNNGTDGTILPGSQIYGNGDHAIYIEAGAGWDIQCRTYGNGAGIGFDGYGAGTLVHDSYIDDGDGVVAALPETGKTFSAAVIGNAALGTGTVGLLPISNCDINGPVTCVGTGDSAPYGVKSSGNKYRANGYMYHQYFGSTRHMISDGDDFSVDDPFRFHNGSSTGKFIVSGAYLKTRGYKISGEFSAANSVNYQVDLYNGSKNQKVEGTISTTTAFTMDVPVAPMGSYDLRTLKVFIETRDNWNGARRAFYEGTIVIMSKVVGTDNITASLEDVIVTGGDWSAVPAISIIDDGAGNATLTFTATATAASGYGKVRVIPT